MAVEVLMMLVILSNVFLKSTKNAQELVWHSCEPCVNILIMIFYQTQFILTNRLKIYELVITTAEPFSTFSKNHNFQKKLTMQ
jgi:hypothetical protein